MVIWTSRTLSLRAGEFRLKFQPWSCIVEPNTDLSCDGKRLIAQDVYGNNGEVTLSSYEGAFIVPSVDKTNWLTTASGGRYGVDVMFSDAFKGYRVVDFETGTEAKFEVVNEIDQPVFGEHGDFALIRHSVPPPPLTSTA